MVDKVDSVLVCLSFLFLPYSYILLIFDTNQPYDRDKDSGTVLTLRNGGRSTWLLTWIWMKPLSPSPRPEAEPLEKHTRNEDAIARQRVAKLVEKALNIHLLLPPPFTKVTTPMSFVFLPFCTTTKP